MVNTQSHDLDLIFHALSDPTRRAMLGALALRERPITEIAEPHDMSLAAVSKHVKVLERAKLVRRRKEGSYSYLTVNGDAMKRADQWLEHYRKFWEERLDALKTYLERETQASPPKKESRHKK